LLGSNSCNEGGEQASSALGLDVDDGQTLDLREEAYLR
jgi:hypothetical protein